MTRGRRAALAPLLLAAACGGEPAGEGEGTPGTSTADSAAGAPREAGPFRFVDATAEAGLDGFRQVNGGPDKPFITETVGAGVGFLDHDRDGDLDVYLTNGSAHEGVAAGDEPADALYVNVGGGRFEDRTASLGLGDIEWTNGVRVFDLQGDGWPDLYLTNYGPNALYVNDGKRFEDATEEAGVGDPAWSTGAAFLDHDRDGDLDLYVSNYVTFDYEGIKARGLMRDYKGLKVMFGPRGLPGASDRFYANFGDGRFVDVSDEVGISGPELFGFQVLAFDHDLDGWLDVYVANDSVGNLLWRNGEGKGFKDVGTRFGLAYSRDGGPQAGMGVAVGDYDGDLLTDVYVTNFSDDYFTLYRGEPRGFFSDVTQRVDLATPTMSSLGWGCGFHDFDDDGDIDLFAVNGHVYPQVDRFELGTSYRQRNFLFENLGTGRFASPAGVGGPGFEVLTATRGAAAGDYDGDGDLDLLFGNLDGPPTLLRNERAPGRWVKVQLVGAGADRDAVGARIVATVGERRMLRLYGTTQSFLSSDDPRAHFGLGDAERVDVVEVTWPDGEVERVEGIDAGTLVTIEKGRGAVERKALGD